jgi:hypothetical protein
MKAGLGVDGRRREVDAQPGLRGGAPEEAQLGDDGVHGAAVEQLVARIGIAPVDAGAAQRGGGEEEPVGRGAVGDAAGHQQRHDAALVRQPGALDDGAQEAPLRGLVDVVDAQPARRGHGARGAGVERQRVVARGVRDQQLDLDREALQRLDRLGAEPRDRAGAFAVGRQGEADALHAAFQDESPSRRSPSASSGAGP